MLRRSGSSGSKQHATNSPLRVGKDFFEKRLLVFLAGNLELLLDEAGPVLVATELHRVT